MTQPPAKSQGAKAIDYAETQLKVHEVYDETVAARAALDELLDDLAGKRDDMHQLETAIEDREFEIVAEERSTHPDMSQAQMDKHVKVAHNKDDGLRAMRTKMYELKSDIDGLEMDRQIHETNIKIGIARMNELAGYLQYLSTAKLANLIAQKGAGDAGSVVPGW